MKDNNKQTTCEQTSSFTQVSTTYARICVILLALNFCITGYVLTGVLKLQQETVAAQSGAPMNAGATVRPATKLTQPATIPTASEEVETLDKE